MKKPQDMLKTGKFKHIRVGIIYRTPYITCQNDHVEATDYFVHGTELHAKEEKM